MTQLLLILISAILTKSFCVLAQGSTLMDKPNERSMHKIPVVRGGGVIFISLSIISFLILCGVKQYDWREEYILLASIAVLATVNFFDDLYSLSAKLRFSVQSLIAIALIYSTYPIKLDFVLFTLDDPIWAYIFLFPTIIWAINHFNFMDGMDGICASQAIFLFAAYTIFFFIHQAPVYQDFSLILLSCLLGFLIFNFPPAKLFMGDVGSATLGLITFSLAIIGQEKYNIPILYWFILNGLFLFDSTITLVRRILNKEKWFAAHKKHAYQRLRQNGVSTQKILSGQAVINAILFFLVWISNHNSQIKTIIFVFPVTLLISIYIFIERKKPMFVDAKS